MTVPTDGRAHVLVVEDEPAVRDVVRRYLEAEGYRVTVAADGITGLETARTAEPDLIVLDIMLPGLDGLQICERLRREDGSAVPIVMLTALGETDDRIAGLTSGADDYVVKPFSVKELVLRVESVLRRSVIEPALPVAEVVREGDLQLNPVSRVAVRGRQPLSLTSREFDLLMFFLRHPGRVFSRDELLNRVWGWDFGDLSTVTVHVKRLRHKIEDIPADPRRIVTVYGRGYRWDPQQDHPERARARQT